MAFREYAGECEASVYSGLSGLKSGQLAATPKQPPLGRLFSALDMMRKAAAVAGETTDRLCGSQPTGEGGKEALGGGGAFTEIEIAADQFQRMAEQIISDMGRIQSRL